MSGYILGGCASAFFLPLLALLVMCGMFIAVGISGNYHYEYRCTDGVVEAQYHALGRAWFGWDAIDGDPVGACDQ